MTSVTRLALVLVSLFLSCGAPPKPPARLGEVAAPSYNRDDWGRWVDADHNCRDTRQEVLIRQSSEPVVFVDPSKPCKVLSGKWIDPYTGQTFTNPSDLEIDHVVPLYQAYWSGGSQWDATKKNAYFNDLADSEALMAVSVSANRSKQEKSPAQWLPPNESDRCRYLLAWTRVKVVWGLTVSPDEAASLVQLIGTYCHK